MARLHLDDVETLSTYVEQARPTIIYHLASDTGRGTGGLNPLDSQIVMGDLRNFLALLKAARAAAPRILVRAGSLAEYGNGVTPSRESQREQPLSAYTAAMALARTVVNRTLAPLARAQAVSRQAGNSVALVSPRLAQSDAMRLIEDDITLRNPALVGGFDLIRAANVLSRLHFQPGSLLRAVENTRSYLRGPGAWLLVLRTHGTGRAASLQALKSRSRMRPSWATSSA